MRACRIICTRTRRSLPLSNTGLDEDDDVNDDDVNDDDGDDADDVDDVDDGDDVNDDGEMVVTMACSRRLILFHSLRRVSRWLCHARR